MEQKIHILLLRRLHLWFQKKGKETKILNRKKDNKAKIIIFLWLLPPIVAVFLRKEEFVKTKRFIAKYKA